jgi:hypothetical protein
MKKPKKHRNIAIVLLHKCGMTFYAIAQAFETRDKRNLTRIWERDKDKYSTNNNKIIIKQ